jgi:hypothetical protein
MQLKERSMKSLELKLGRLHLKVMSGKLLLFAGNAVGQKRGLHFTQYFEPLRGRLRPHLTDPQGGRHKYLGLFTPKRFQEVMEAYEKDLVEGLLEAATRVEPKALEADGWFILCPEVTQREWAARLQSGSETLTITEGALEDAEVVAQKAARPAGLLHQVTSVTHPHPISAFRLTKAGEYSESAFIYYFPDGLKNDVPGWYLVPQALFSRDRQEELMLRHFPPAVWKVLLSIHDHLGLDGDREKLLRFANGQR